MDLTQIPASSHVDARPAGAEPAVTGAPVRFGRAGAVYDLVVTIAFATPLTAAGMLDLQRRLHDLLGAGGAPVPEFGPAHLMFTAMMGTAVTMWAIARIRYPVAPLIAIDTVGRVAFSAWMTFALASGASTVIVGFLALEVTWGILQAIGLVEHPRASARRANTAAAAA
ncbi:hypothetical protein ACGGZK_10010 [Agromyces sp. MMS24-K17]|uniref:hypothetical protein n=1 Tax=Agromyces sp. MMS24-K17 TaxID=3372850 RepID=UPI0037547A57